MRKKQDTLPMRPFDVLAINSTPLRVLIATVIWLAEKIGFWRRPFWRAATAIEEMGPLDSIYWIYKSKHLLTEPDPKLKVDFVEIENDEAIKLNDVSKHGSPVEITFVGDILRSSDIDHENSDLYSQIRTEVFGSDLTIANFESPVTDGELVEEVIGQDGPPTECCSPEQFDYLTSSGEDRLSVINLANNHILDLGMEGIDRTIEEATRLGVTTIGMNNSSEEVGKPDIVDVDGLRIGLVSYTFGLNGHELPHEQSNRINVAPLCPKKTPPDASRIISEIKAAKTASCDAIIVMLHWGHEFETYPRQSQVDLAHEIAEAGADAIIGHHPHVPQPIEVYTTKGSEPKKVPIAYSLGSLNWGFLDETIASSLILKLTVARDKPAPVRAVNVTKVRKTKSGIVLVENDQAIS